MGLAQYQIVSHGDEWGILHDGEVKHRLNRMAEAPSDAGARPAGTHAATGRMA